MKTAIELTNVTKTYQLYARPSLRLYEALWPFGKPRHVDFSAVRDITFTLEQGESLGIIGRNGSGKSTLLKIIAGILSPSSGSVTVNGRIGCLLELGGGFNAELTGLENARIQLLFNRMPLRSAALLDELIDFAELGDFIEKPVKTYSSGMFMRLAFACATAISPSILIVDEALAVGDAYFVQKCMNRMSGLLAQGTTLLFVSHDLEAVRQLCDKSLLLDRGHQIEFGLTCEVAEKYVGLLRMEARQTEPAIAKPQTRCSAQAKDCLTQALHRVVGSIDLAEQRLYVNGFWAWHVSSELGISARVTHANDAKAAFLMTGNRLSLSFLRGGGFALPKIQVDGNSFCLKTENDVPYFDPTKARPQIRNFTQTLTSGEHTVVITAHHGPAAWLGGNTAEELLTLTFLAESNWRKSLPSNVLNYGDEKAIITHVELLDACTLEPLDSVVTGNTVRMRIHAKRLTQLGENVSVGFKVQNKLSVGLFGTSTREEHYALNASATSWVVEFMFSLPLKDGVYNISAAIVSVIGTKQIVHHYIDVASQVKVSCTPQRTVWGVFNNSTQIAIAEY